MPTLDDHGLILTGRDGATWLERSLSGGFAAGDIRAGSIKRVAAAAGEGSTASMMAREHLMTSAEVPRRWPERGDLHALGLVRELSAHLHPQGS